MYKDKYALNNTHYKGFYLKFDQYISICLQSIKPLGPFHDTYDGVFLVSS